jgi:Ca-activated chloride channel homolog
MLPCSRPTCLVFSLFITVVGALGAAQSSATPEAPSTVFRSRTDLVALDVSVEDQAGEFVAPLTADQFLVLEDNVPQKVTIFSAEGRMPLAVALLVDHSQSMEGERLDHAKAAAGAFLRALEPADLVEVLAFNEASNRLYPLGTDHAAAEESIADLSASGATGLYDAVLVGLRDLERAQRDRSVDFRQVLVILSDGEDTASHDAFEDVLGDARRSRVAIDVISLRTDSHDRWLAPARELAQLAFDTGGQAVAVRRLADLASIYEGIAAELRHQYRLGYVSSSTIDDGRWRRISVRTANKDLVVRTRAGYYARVKSG